MQCIEQAQDEQPLMPPPPPPPSRGSVQHQPATATKGKAQGRERQSEGPRDLIEMFEESIQKQNEEIDRRAAGIMCKSMIVLVLIAKKYHA